MQRNCTFSSIAASVEAKLQDKQVTAAGLSVADMQEDTKLKVSEAAVRLYCLPTRCDTKQGKRHKPIAQISHRKLSAGAEDWNIDGRLSNARVRVLEQFALHMLEKHEAAVLMSSDDHAKFEADKNRGHLSHRTIVHKRERKTAAHQDMRPAIPGIAPPVPCAPRPASRPPSLLPPPPPLHGAFMSSMVQV